MIELSGDRLRVTGPMTIESAAALMAAGEAAVHSGSASVIDLSGVDDADSSALAVLFGWLRAAGEKGGGLSIVDAPAGLRSLATLYGVADLLPLA
jgi:phospholipid transport system transporter-binding protein